MQQTHTNYVFKHPIEQEYTQEITGCHTSISALPASLKNLLDAYYHKRFRQNQSTAKLLENAQNEAERRIISIVAMLDLDQANLKEGITPTERHFIGSCHHYLRRHCQKE